MPVRGWLDDHWLGCYLGATVLIFAVAVLLWKPGTRPWAAGTFVLGLVLVGSLVTVVVTSWLVPVDEEPEGRRPGRSG